MARIETWTCGNCWAEEDAPDTDVDECTGEYLCTDCRAQGKESLEARRRRYENGGPGFGGRVRFADLNPDWELEDKLEQQRLNRGRAKWPERRKK